MEILDYYREIQLKAAKDAYKATCHYLIIKDDKPHPYGSGVFIEIDSSKFLITAAHVVDDMEDDIYVGVDTHRLLKLGGDLTKNIAPGHRDDDKIDISILKLNQETIDKLGDKYEFISQSELGINHEFKRLPFYTSVGFPASKSKYNSHKDEIISKPFIYTTMPAESPIYAALKCESFSNVIVHYDKEKVKDYTTGQFQTGPDPFGISGSGLWFTTPQAKGEGEHIDKKLVAIMTEWPLENRLYWIGTRIDVITEIIRQKYNLTLEKSKVVRVNL
jgi:hypothetical protein